MAPRAYGFVCGIVFLFVAAIHLIRLVSRSEVFFENYRVPHWISVPGFLFAAVLSLWGLAIARGRASSKSRR